MNSLELNDNQFLKIRLDARGYAVLWKIQQLRPTRWTYTSETKVEVMKSNFKRIAMGSRFFGRSQK